MIKLVFWFLVGWALGMLLLTPQQVSVTCYEDEVILWNGDTNTHDICWALDDVSQLPHFNSEAGR